MLLFASLLALIAVPVASGQTHSEALRLFRNTFNGDATYYGNSGQGGTCSYGWQNPPVASQVQYPVALNQAQFLGSLMCGSCWRVKGSGQGQGQNPVTGDFLVFVNNLCPGCNAGDVDLGVVGNGRWKVSIQAVQCPVGDGRINFKFQGSNPWWLKLQTQNSRLPVHTMEIELNGNWRSGTHSSDGFFIFTRVYVDGGFRVRLTAINGAQVMDYINGIVNDVVIPGTQQFPYDSTLQG